MDEQPLDRLLNPSSRCLLLPAHALLPPLAVPRVLASRTAAPGRATGLRPYVPPLLAAPRGLRPLRTAAAGPCASPPLAVWLAFGPCAPQPAVRPAFGHCALQAAASHAAGLWPLCTAACCHYLFHACVRTPCLVPPASPSKPPEKKVLIVRINSTF